MPRTAKLACAPHLPPDPLQAPCAGRVPLLGHGRAPALFFGCALPFSPRAARPNVELGPALCSSSQSLRCRLCVVVSFYGNAHFVVVLRFLLDTAWVLVVGKRAPVSFVLSSSFGHPTSMLVPTFCLRLVFTPTKASQGVEKRFPSRCPQVLGERHEQESSMLT
jgi:hypothetical protein